MLQPVLSYRQHLKVLHPTSYLAYAYLNQVILDKVAMIHFILSLADST
ncbi:hypothetical protein [Gloeocapsopsis sp. IPPAS B-1203]|nr:hypothetical protein [Gloeocapsopsis sp. IPPAS B-1203]